MLIPNLTSGNSTDANSITSFDTDGFTLGTDGAILMVHLILMLHGIGKLMVEQHQVIQVEH